MAKELQVAKLGEGQVTTSTIVELMKVTLGEVSFLEVVMQKLYLRFVTMHMSVFHHNGW